MANLKSLAKDTAIYGMSSIIGGLELPSCTIIHRKD